MYVHAIEYHHLMAKCVVSHLGYCRFMTQYGHHLIICKYKLLQLENEKAIVCFSDFTNLQIHIYTASASLHSNTFFEMLRTRPWKQPFCVYNVQIRKAEKKMIKISGSLSLSLSPTPSPSTPAPANVPPFPPAPHMRGPAQRAARPLI